MADKEKLAKMQHLPLSSIRPNVVALRAVNQEGEEFIGIKESVEHDGVQQSITVREAKDKESGEKYYEIIDGLQRFTASQLTGKNTIPAIVVEADDLQVLKLQVVGNIHRVETKPKELQNQLVRLMSLDPAVTKSSLAADFSKSPAWVDNILSLSTVKNEKIIQMINDGKISATKAYALAKLPVEEQDNYVDDAITLPADEFVTKVNTRAKELRDAKRAGRSAAPPTFVATAKLRKLADLKNEMDNMVAAKGLLKSAKTPEDGYKAAFAYIFQLDDASIAASKAKWDAQEDEKAARAARIKEAKAAKKAAEAAKMADEAKAEMAAAKG